MKVILLAGGRARGKKGTSLIKMSDVPFSGLTGHSMQRFVDNYRKLVEQYVRPLSAVDGYTAQTINMAESRLGVTFPKVMTDFYNLAGRLDELNTAHHQLVPFSRLKLVGTLLPFYEENEAVFYWAINTARLSENDPPVYQLVPESEEILEDGGILSDFLINMFFVQCLNGALKYSAMAMINQELASQLIRTWQPTDLIVPPYSEDHTVFASDSVLASLTPTDIPGRFTLTVATQVESEFNALRQQLPVRWLLHT